MLGLFVLKILKSNVTVNEGNGLKIMHERIIAMYTKTKRQHISNLDFRVNSFSYENKRNIRIHCKSKEVKS